jgi:hypothetical protein
MESGRMAERRTRYQRARSAPDLATLCRRGQAIVGSVGMNVRYVVLTDGGPGVASNHQATSQSGLHS